MEGNDISASELKQRLAGEELIQIIDVREELEFHTFNIGGKNIPLGRLASVISDLEFDESEEIVLICQRGLRSRTAAEMFRAAGFLNARNLSRGLLAYNR